MASTEETQAADAIDDVIGSLEPGDRVVLVLTSEAAAREGMSCREGAFVGATTKAVRVREQRGQKPVSVSLDDIAALGVVLTKELLASLLHVPPETPIYLDLVGTREAADLLQVERPRIGKWRDSGMMPEPAATFRAGPVWWKYDVEQLLEGREQRRRAPR